MNALTMGAIWAGVAVGLLVIVAGLRGHQLFPERQAAGRTERDSNRTTAVVAAAR